MSRRLRSNAAPAGLWSIFSLLIAAALVGLLAGEPIRVRVARLARKLAGLVGSARRSITDAGAGLRRRQDGLGPGRPHGSDAPPMAEPAALTPGAQLGKLERHVAQAAAGARLAGRCHTEAAAKLDYVELALQDLKSQIARIQAPAQPAMQARPRLMALAAMGNGSEARGATGAAAIAEAEGSHTGGIAEEKSVAA